MDDDKVASVSTFMGQGPPRFYLPVDPEKAYQSYAQLIINVHDLKGLNQLIPEMDSWIQEEVSESLMFFRRYGLGPSQTWKVEAQNQRPRHRRPGNLRGSGSAKCRNHQGKSQCQSRSHRLATAGQENCGRLQPGASTLVWYLDEQISDERRAAL